MNRLDQLVLTIKHRKPGDLDLGPRKPRADATKISATPHTIDAIRDPVTTHLKGVKATYLNNIQNPSGIMGYEKGRELATHTFMSGKAFPHVVSEPGYGTYQTFDTEARAHAALNALGIKNPANLEKAYAKQTA